MVAVAGIIAAVATVAVALDPSTRLAFRAAELRTAVETAQALIALSAAYLVFGRVRQRRCLNDLAIVFALALLAASSLFFAALPATALDGSRVFETWAPQVNRVIAAVVITWAALAKDRPMPTTYERPGLRVIVAADVVVAVAAIITALLVNVLPEGVQVTGGTSRAPELDGHPVFLGIFVLIAVLSVAAARGFLERAEKRRDPLTAALAVASVLQGFAFVCFAVYPSVDTEVVQSGDVLRLGFYLVLLVGGEREIDRYWNRLTDAAIYEERRRLARDLHDGVAQELAYVVTQTRLLQRGTAAPGTDDRVAASAERALDESRRAIIALTLRDDEPLHLALARAAEDVAGRVGVEVEVEISPTVVVSAEQREALVRIVQEAVGNAGRHGKATRVRITYGTNVLRIADDGVGFDTGMVKEGRFGLVSMRERAERLGGRFQVMSEPGHGTIVEVAVR